MRKFLWRITYTLLAILSGWIVLTLWAESTGPKKSWSLSNTTGKKAIIIYDPDPFYNLDEKVCLAFGNALADKGMSVSIATVAAVSELNPGEFDLYIICSNTYNWRPDWAISRFVKTHSFLKRPVVAITLGSGSTNASKNALEKMITKNGGNIIDSRSLWLLRSNDESRIKESNIEVAVSIAGTWADKIARQINN